MAKPAYGIRTGLDQSRLDQAINPMGGGAGAGSYITLRCVLYWIGLFLVGTWGGFGIYGRLGPLYVLVFESYVLAVGLILFTPTPMHSYRFRQIPIVIRYFTTKREVPTAGRVPVSALMRVSPILDVGPDGTIVMAGAMYGYAYEVEGTASKFLFDADRASVVDSWDNATRRMDVEVGMSIVTVRSAENVDTQLAALQATRRALGPDPDPELLELLDEQHAVLSRHVAARFQTTTQIVILYSANRELLDEQAGQLENAARAGRDIRGLQAGAEVVRSARRLGRDDVRSLEAHLIGPLDPSTAESGEERP